MTLKQLYSQEAWEQEFKLSQERIDFWGWPPYDEEDYVYRIPFSGEDMSGTLSHCPDCGVTKGYRHLRGCSEEVCGNCQRQVITCACWADEKALFRYALQQTGLTEWYLPIFPLRPYRDDQT